MALLFNGVEVNDIWFNGVQVQELWFNGVQILSVGSGGGAGNTTLLSSALGWDGVTPVNYYGEVPASEFFTGSELSTLLSVTEGELQNSNTDWFKFGIGDKTLFIPKMNIRFSISWDHLYSKGLVYGTNNNGLAPTGTPTNQMKIVSKNGFNYKVRLIRGSSIDPYNGTSGNNVAISQGSEWNELMYRVSSANPNGTSKNFAMYTDAQLNITSGNGTYTWCQEQYSTTRVFRGTYSVGTLYYNTSSNVYNTLGWRPALELIP